MKFKKIAKYIFVFVLISVWIFGGWPQIWKNPAFPPEIQKSYATPTADGRIVYSINTTTPQNRTYAASTNTFSTAAATVVGAAQTFIVDKASATRNEHIAGYVTTGGVLYILRWNGSAWSAEWNVTVGGNGVDGRRFDIAYEKTSGKAMVVYSTNATGAAGNEMAYRIWDGSTWATAVNINSTGFAQAAAVTWIKMKSKPLSGSNEIALTAEDTGLAATGNTAVLTSFIWNGAAWTEAGTAHATNMYSATTTQLVQNDIFDMAYESLSGDLLVFWTQSTPQQTYRTYSGGVWGTSTSNGTTRAAPHQVIAESNPYTDQIVISFGRSGSATAYGRIWSGTAWGTNTSIGTNNATQAIEKKQRTAKWLRVGTTDYAVVVWDTSTAGTLGYNYFTGTAWGTAATYVTGAGASANWMDSALDPQGADTMMLTFSTGAAGTGSLWAKRLVLSAGPTFTWTNADGGTALSTALASVTSQNFYFAYNLYIPPIVNQAAYRWFSDSSSTQIGSPLTALQDQAATLTSTGQSFRLRLLLDIGTGPLSKGEKQFKLRFAAKGGAASCSAVATSTFADVTGATVMSFYNNSSFNDGDLLTASSTSDPGYLGHTIVTQTVEKANNFLATTTVPAGQAGEWDFDLYDNAATASTTYCFIVTDSSGTDLNTYTSYPEITTASAASTVSCSAATTTTAFGALTTASVFTSSPGVTSTMSCTYAAGCTLSVNDANAGLYNSTSTGYTIPSPVTGNPATTTLAAGTEGYGVQAATSSAGSGGTLTLNSRYNQTGNTVGGLTTSTITLASSTQTITSREVVVTHKAAISGLTWAGTYADTITYSCVGN